MLSSAEMCSSSCWNSSSHPRISLHRCPYATSSSAYPLQNSRTCRKYSSSAFSPCAVASTSAIFSSFSWNAGVQKSRTRRNSTEVCTPSAPSTTLQCRSFSAEPFSSASSLKSFLWLRIAPCSVVKHAYCLTRDGTVSSSHSTAVSSWLAVFGTNTDHIVSPSAATRAQNGWTLSHASCSPASSVSTSSSGFSRCTSSPSASRPLFTRVHFSLSASARSRKRRSTSSAVSTDTSPSSGFCSSHSACASWIVAFSFASSATTLCFSCSCAALIASCRRATICSRHDQSFSTCWLYTHSAGNAKPCCSSRRWHVSSWSRCAFHSGRQCVTSRVARIRLIASAVEALMDSCSSVPRDWPTCFTNACVCVKTSAAKAASRSLCSES